MKISIRRPLDVCVLFLMSLNFNETSRFSAAHPGGGGGGGRGGNVYGRGGAGRGGGGGSLHGYGAPPGGGQQQAPMSLMSGGNMYGGGGNMYGGGGGDWNMQAEMYGAQAMNTGYHPFGGDQMSRV